MGFLKGLGVVVGCLVVVFGFVWLAQGNDFFMYKVFAPAKANVEREVFENTNTHVRGLNITVQQAQMDYAQADPAHKAAISAVLLQQMADVPMEKLTPQNAAFVQQLRGNLTAPMSTVP
jgi:hypothetical protein